MDTSKPNHDPVALRRAAEARLQARTTASPPQTEADLRRLQHELEVHQIELEIQNEELAVAKAELGAELERFTDLYNFAPLGYFNLTNDGTIRLVNFAGAKLVGLERAELMGRHFQLLVPETGRTDFNTFLQQAFATRTKQTCELTLLKKNEPMRFVHLEATLAPDGQRCRLVMLDITERKQVEEALRASETRLEYALRMSQIGAWELNLLDHTAHRTLIHDRIFGYQTLLPHWTYEMALEHVLPEDRPVFEESFRRANETHSDWNFECRIRRADGEVRWIWAAGSHQRNAEGIPVSMSGIVQDITERKQLDETRVRLAAIVQSSDDAIIGKTLDGIITSWNLGAQTIFGYAEQEVLGQPMLTMFPPDRRHEETQILARIKRGEKVDHYETVRVRKDGSRIDVAVTISPIRDACGKIIGASKIARDITERKQAEEVLFRKSADLEAALAKVKLLTGLLPICAGCKKIRDDHGYWNQVEKYIAEHSEATFTHGYCPDCIKKYFPGM